MASAALWAEAARLGDGALADAGRAMTAWQNAVRLDPGTEALDALGRLALAAGDALTAADWLDRRLAMTEGEARSEVAARLAGAYVAAGQRHRAIACLERALGESPRADRLRTMLADLYRDAQSWEPLARVLAEGCDHGGDDAVTVARASEVAEIYTRLGLLERAVPVLEKAVRLVPQHDGLGLALADGLGPLRPLRRRARPAPAPGRAGRLAADAEARAVAPAPGRHRARPGRHARWRWSSSSRRRRWTSRAPTILTQLGEVAEARATSNAPSAPTAPC